MDIHSNLEYLCRVCAANTKGKNSVAECVYIFKTVGLKDKLDKFLYLKISEKDSLPKVLCKSCFRQVEAAASLSKIAKHTQQVFRDFLLSNLPKGPLESSSTAEFTSSDFMGNNNDTSEKNTALAPALTSSVPQLPPPPPPPPPTQTAAASLPPPLVQTLATAARKEDVVVNVSVTDPLTRDNQQKMISNSQRRQSLLLESRFTPKSIAQKQVAASIATPRHIAPKPNTQNEILNMANNPKASAPIINFYPVKAQQQAKAQQQPPQATQITTFSSGGYVIGRINTNPSDKEEPKKLSLPLTPSVDNILQQKRKNLVKALNNIKANNSGQVSLLKSSQQKQAEALQNLAKTAFTEVVNQATDDELPEKIIIAAPKNKTMADKSRKEPLNLSSKIPATIAPLPATAVQQQPEQINPLNGNLPKPAFPDDITLGRVIRDMDLLKLILKALKWPVNKQNIELQLQRLRSSKFTDIMSDPNLLQDTDLTQLLGPYLAPVLLAAQVLQQQQQQILNNATILNSQTSNTTLPSQPKMTALEAAQAEINKSIPYKLPPETSVQLVPATPEDTETTPTPLPTVNTSTTASISLKREKPKETKSSTGSQKRQRRSAAQKARDSIIISDEEELATGEVAAKKPRSNKSAANIQLELDANFVSQFNLLNGSGGNEPDELMALLLKQKAALLKDNKVQKWRRNSVSNLITLPPSEFDALIELDDDIVLMEPASTASPEGVTSTSTPEQQPQKTDITNTFVIPSVPLITRPIIKRRKTVIHSPKNRFNLLSEINNKEPNSNASVSLLKSKDKLIEETINQVVAGNVTNTDSTVPPNAASTFAVGKAVLAAPVELPPAKTQAQQKKTQSKSNLGKQLLEAIGLQKLPPKSTNTNTLNETPSSSSVPKAKMMLPSSKQSIQQIRSALKKSLKQAQEQQQQKQKELSSASTNSVIQDADSLTKSAIKEVLVVEGKANQPDNCSSEVDVEEQIDKVTLMVRNNEEETDEQEPTKNKTDLPTVEEKKEGKKSATSKMQERPRTIANRNTEDKEKCKEEQVQESPQKSAETMDTDTENEKEKLSTEVFVSYKSNESAPPVSDEIVVPKRRGRKRLLDKQLELEAAEAREKEKVNKITPSLTEKLQTLDKSPDEETETTNSFKTEEESEINKTSGRPTRQSKTQSRYYKGPDKPALGKRALPSRTTRNRKYC